MQQQKHIIAQKQLRWEHHQRECAMITDRLNTPLDPGIVETIVAFHALQIHTDGSCEGHLDHGSGAPYVDIEALGIEELEYQGLQMLYAAEEEADHEHISREEIEHRRTTAKAILGVVARKRLEARIKVCEYLEEFYRQRYVSVDQRLVIQGIVLQGLYTGPSRLESQGVAIQTIRDDIERHQKLKTYQNEMAAFTLFLKNVFFTRENV